MKSTALPFRIGLGYDSHRLGPGGPLRIGGLDVGDAASGEGFHAIGHSDADVLLHALTDALLGAITAPDIGRLFPNDAEVNRHRDSSEFVLAAREKVIQAGYTVGNLDAVILLQKPKLASHIDPIRKRIAELLRCPVDTVGLKAKTGEGVDAVGRSEAVAARVVVLLLKMPC